MFHPYKPCYNYPTFGIVWPESAQSFIKVGFKLCPEVEVD